MHSNKKGHYYKKSGHKSTSWLTKWKPRASVLYRPDVGLGRSVATRLKTVAFVNVNVNGVNVVYNLLPGSAFNPLGDMSGIQPAAFDQWKLLFARYLVTGATVHIEGTINSLATSLPNIPIGMVAAYPSTVVGPIAASASFQGYASQPYAQSKQVIQGAPSAKLFFKLSSQQVIGRRTPVNAEDNGALISASPTTGENMVMPVFLQAANSGPLLIDMVLRVTIIQDVVFDQRIQVVDA